MLLSGSNACSGSQGLLQERRVKREKVLILRHPKGGWTLNSKWRRKPCLSVLRKKAWWPSTPVQHDEKRGLTGTTTRAAAIAILWNVAKTSADQYWVLRRQEKYCFNFQVEMSASSPAREISSCCNGSDGLDLPDGSFSSCSGDCPGSSRLAMALSQSPQFRMSPTTVFPTSYSNIGHYFKNWFWQWIMFFLHSLLMARAPHPTEEEEGLTPLRWTRPPFPGGWGCHRQWTLMTQFVWTLRTNQR